MQKTEAIIIDDVRSLSYETLDLPKMGKYDVLFKTSYCSLCTIDRRTYLGTRSYKLPFLGGHECSGEILKVGEGVLEVSVGDKAIFTASYCNQCKMCRLGKGTQCQNKNKLPKKVVFAGGVVGGGLSQYLVIPAWQIIKVDESVDLRHAALTEPLACCIHSMNKVNLKYGENVAIIGYGIMGYLHHQLVKNLGGIPIVLENDQEKLQLAREHGAKVYDTNNPKWMDDLKIDTLGGADVVINAIPHTEMWGKSQKILAPFGRLVAFSSQNEKIGIPVDFGLMHGKEYEYIGTINPSIVDNHLALELITNNIIDMEPVIDSMFNFTDAKSAFEEGSIPNKYRILISFKED